MDTINFSELFDDFILTPGFQRDDIKEWFNEEEEKRNRKAVYGVFNKQFKPLYIGSSINPKRRLPEHLHQDKLEGHFDEVLFIGIKYVENGDLRSEERQYIRKLKPMLNKHTYESYLRKRYLKNG